MKHIFSFLLFFLWGSFAWAEERLDSSHSLKETGPFSKEKKSINISSRSLTKDGQIYCLKQKDGFEKVFTLNVHPNVCEGSLTKALTRFVRGYRLIVECPEYRNRFGTKKGELQKVSDCLNSYLTELKRYGKAHVFQGKEVNLTKPPQRNPLSSPITIEKNRSHLYSPDLISTLETLERYVPLDGVLKAIISYLDTYRYQQKDVTIKIPTSQAGKKIDFNISKFLKFIEGPGLSFEKNIDKKSENSDENDIGIKIITYFISELITEKNFPLTHATKCSFHQVKIWNQKDANTPFSSLIMMTKMFQNLLQGCSKKQKEKSFQFLEKSVQKNDFSTLLEAPNIKTWLEARNYKEETLKNRVRQDFFEIEQLVGFNTYIQTLIRALMRGENHIELVNKQVTRSEGIMKRKRRSSQRYGQKVSVDLSGFIQAVSQIKNLNPQKFLPDFLAVMINQMHIAILPSLPGKMKEEITESAEKLKQVVSVSCHKETPNAITLEIDLKRCKKDPTYALALLYRFDKFYKVCESLPAKDSFDKMFFNRDFHRYSKCINESFKQISQESFSKSTAYQALQFGLSSLSKEIPYQEFFSGLRREIKGGNWNGGSYQISVPGRGGNNRFTENLNFSKHALVNFVDATLGDARSDLVQFSKDLKHPSMIRDARKRFKKNEKKEALAVLEFFSKNSLSKA